jgi:hypothetical protein
MNQTTNLSGNMRQIEWKYLLYALLLYIPTLNQVREELQLLIVPVILLLDFPAVKTNFTALIQGKISSRWKWTLALLAAIMVFSLVNKIFNGNEILCVKDYYASFYLVPITFFVGKYVGKQSVFKFVLILICLEILVGIIEYFSGLRSFSGCNNAITDKSLLYNSRIFGLSSNSSVLAIKVMVGFVLIDYTEWTKKINYPVRLLLFIGLILTFNRTVLVALVVYWILVLLRTLCKTMIHKQKIRLRTNLPLQVALFTLLLIGVLAPVISHQFTRGGMEMDTLETKLYRTQERMSCAEMHAPELQTPLEAKNKQVEKIMGNLGSVELSGRKLIWFNFLHHIAEKPLFGNGSDKLYFRSWQPTKKQFALIHAHNSFLELLATNGLLIFALYLVFYLSLLNRYNWVPLIAFGVYSLGQYGIFWGMSFLDVFLVVFLFLPKPVKAHAD